MIPFEEAYRQPLVAMYDALDSRHRSSGLPPKTRAGIEAWLDGLLDVGWHLIALDGDLVVGHVGVSPAGAAEPEFVIFVNDDYHGRGIGTELIRQLAAYGASRGHAALRLSVQRSNERAITVYENCAFEIESEDLVTIAMRLSMEDPSVLRARRPPADR